MDDNSLTFLSTSIHFAALVDDNSLSLLLPSIHCAALVAPYVLCLQREAMLHTKSFANEWLIVNCISAPFWQVQTAVDWFFFFS
jgi:hypothetical protein